MIVEEFRCYFETPSGMILVSEESFEDPEAAALWGSRILDNPDMFDLVNADDEVIPATEIDQELEYTVEGAEIFT